MNALLRNCLVRNTSFLNFLFQKKSLVLFQKKSLVAFSMLLLASSFCSAQTIAQQESRLADLESQLQKQRTSLQALQTELDEYPERIASAEADVDIATQDAKKENAELSRLENLAQNEGQDLSREIKLQSHAAKMADRRVDSQTRSLERVQRYQESLQADIDKSKALVTRLEQQASQQRTALANARSDAAKAEANRAAVVVPAPPKIEPAPVQAAPKPAPAPAPAPEAKPVAVAAAAEPASKAKDESSLSDEDMATLQSMREYFAQLEAFKASGQAEFVRFSNLTLSGSKIRGRASFEHVANNQYKAEARAGSGRQFISVNKSQFMIDVPKSGDGDLYMFYFDGSDDTRLRVIFFKKSLLDYL